MPSTPSPAYRRGLQAVIALQCLLILAFVLQGIATPGPFGPRLPAVSGHTLWLESHGALHQFSGDGKRLRRVELSALGLSSPTSLQFTQGHIAWVHDAGRVHRCDLQVLRCAPLALADLSDRQGYRWVRVSDDETEITVSDASQHRVLVYRRDAAAGQYALAQTHAAKLRFPNQTLQVRDALWIADTNHHQIAQIEDGTLARSDASIASVALRPGRLFPFAMARDPQERLWVLVGDFAMQRADLLLMDRLLRPERVLPLTETQDPNAIALFQQQMLLTDMTQFTVHRLDLNGRVLPPFGDESFRSELAAAQRQAQWMRRLPALLMGTMGALLLVGLWLAWKSGDLRSAHGPAWRRPAPLQKAAEAPMAIAPAAPAVVAPPPPAPIARGAITVVHALPGSTRVQRRWFLAGGLVMTTGLMTVLVLPLLRPLLRQDCGSGLACQPALALFAVSALALSVLLGVSGWRQLKAYESMRVGTDGLQVQVRIGRRRHKALADQVTCTRTHLLIGHHSVPLRLRNTPLFDEDALRRDFIDRLPQMHVPEGFWSNGVLKHYWHFAGWKGRALVCAWLTGVGAMLSIQLWDALH